MLRAGFVLAPHHRLRSLLQIVDVRRVPDGDAVVFRIGGGEIIPAVNLEHQVCAEARSDCCKQPCLVLSIRCSSIYNVEYIILYIVVTTWARHCRKMLGCGCRWAWGVHHLRHSRPSCRRRRRSWVLDTQGRGRLRPSAHARRRHLGGRADSMGTRTLGETCRKASESFVRTRESMGSLWIGARPAMMRPAEDLLPGLSAFGSRPSIRPRALLPTDGYCLKSRRDRRQRRRQVL